MDIVVIEGATRSLGAPPGWDHERDGACTFLPIRDELHGAQPVMVSAWRPTPDELARLNAGAAIHLSVVGAGHPPVMLLVPDITPPRPDVPRPDPRPTNCRDRLQAEGKAYPKSGCESCDGYDLGRVRRGCPHEGGRK